MKKLRLVALLVVSAVALAGCESLSQMTKNVRDVRNMNDDLNHLVPG